MDLKIEVVPNSIIEQPDGTFVAKCIVTGNPDGLLRDVITPLGAECVRVINNAVESPAEFNESDFVARCEQFIKMMRFHATGCKSEIMVPCIKSDEQVTNSSAVEVLPEPDNIATLEEVPERSLDLPD